MMRFLRSLKRAVPGAAGVAALLWLAAGLLAPPARAVILNDDKRIDLTLSDNTHVTLFAQEEGSAPGGGVPYYYLPVNLRLAAGADSTPQFLFLKFTTEKRTDQGGAEGGLIHFLMQWGLSAAQEAEARVKLKQKDPKGVLMGAAPVDDEGEGSGSFQVISATLSDNKMSNTLVSSGKAPIVPGGLCAAAARLSPEGAQLLAASFEKSRSIADVSIALNFDYTTLMPAAEGKIIMNWSKLQSHFDSLGAEYNRRQTGSTTTTGTFLGIPVWSNTNPDYAYSYDEMKKQYDFLTEKNIITFSWKEGVVDDRITKVREAFLTYFINSMAQPAPQAPPAAPSDSEKAANPDIKYGTHYKFLKTSLTRAFESKVESVSLNLRLPVKHPLQIVGNLASWYDGVRNNPRCVAAVNLNDPFFSHRDIDFILDLDAKDMFENEANYVTVNVRKNRSSGNPFEDHVTIDAKYLKDNGINAKVTYARGEDQNPDVYEYQAEWSFRGGRIWPTNPPWQRGSWEGVTLSAPIAPRTIEVEGDLDALKASGIARVTAQIHYEKFGTEMEDNISVSPVKNEPLVSKRIYMDAGSKGYAYRLIIDSKTDGKLATPWSAKVADDYIFAAVPKDMLEQPTLKAQAKEAALDAASSAKEKVLTKFADLLGGLKQ